MAVEHLPELDEECFFIAPIGDEGSEVRDRSDGVMEYIVGPAAQEHALETVRADKIAKPGQITRQVIEHVVGAKAAVVDLTEANPNVYDEMAVRHTAQLPTVLIAQDGEKLPFDIAQMRTIFFDHTSLKSAAECRAEIAKHLGEALGGEVDSPIAASVAVQRLESGTPQERILAQLVENTDEIRLRMRQLETGRPGTDRRMRRALRIVLEAVTDLRNMIAHGRYDEKVVASTMLEIEGPLRYLGENLWPDQRMFSPLRRVPTEEPIASDERPAAETVATEAESSEGESDGG
jgi:protein-tyrosine-phosphatase